MIHKILKSLILSVSFCLNLATNGAEHSVDLTFKLEPGSFRALEGELRGQPEGGDSDSASMSGTIEATVVFDDETLLAKNITVTGGRIATGNIEISTEGTAFIKDVGTVEGTVRIRYRNIAETIRTPSPPGTVLPSGQLIPSQHVSTVNEGTLTVTISGPGLGSQSQTRNFSDEHLSEAGKGSIRLVITQLNATPLERTLLFRITTANSYEESIPIIEGSSARLDLTETTETSSAATATIHTIQPRVIFDDRTINIPREIPNDTEVARLHAAEPDLNSVSYTILNNLYHDGDSNPAFRVEGNRLLVNDSGDLTFQPRLIPIAAGGYHNLAVHEDSGFAWGNNEHGQGNVPINLGGVRAVSAGAWHSMALRTDGTILAWGNNDHGQLSAPGDLGNVIAIAAGAQHSLALRGNGKPVAWGRNNNGQGRVPGDLENLIAIAAGAYHNLALKEDGAVAAWGRNDFGQATLPAGLNGVIAIAAGGYHNLALKQDGSVVAWGRNDFGQATVPAGLNAVIAIAAGAYHNLALKQDGSVVAWGRNDFGQATVPVNPGKIIAVYAGFFHSMTLEDSKLVSWGRNNFGQAAPPQGLRITQPGMVNIQSLQVVVRAANDGWLSDDAVITITLSNDLNDPSPQFNLNISATRLPSGALDLLTVNFPTKSGTSYRIEESLDMKTWRTRESGINGNGDIIQRSFPAEGKTWFLRAREQ